MSRKSNTHKKASEAISWKRAHPLHDQLLLIQSEEEVSPQIDLFDDLLVQSLPKVQSQDQSEEPAVLDPLEAVMQAYSFDQSPSPPAFFDKPLQRTSQKIEVEELFPSRKGCTCTSSKCEKKYCDCFKMGHACMPGVCSCKGCYNVEVKSIHYELHQKWLQKVNESSSGCNCKKSQCLKKYCQCYSSGRKCGSQCECTSCCNMQQKEEGRLQSVAKKRKTGSFFGTGIDE